MSERAKHVVPAAAFLASFLTAFFIYMRWREGDGSWLGQAEAWIVAHDQQLDLMLGWVLCVGFGILAAVEGVTWWVVRAQDDRTDVGRTLKQKKIAGCAMFGILTSLYALGLAAYYTRNVEVFGPWQRLGLRAILAVGIVSAVIAGVQFVRALRAEEWGMPVRDRERADGRERPH